MALQPQACSHRRQPVQRFSITLATPKKSPTCSPEVSSSRASKGQMLMQSSQPEPMQLSSMTSAFGHSRRGNPLPMSPASSAMHSTGQTTPQAPQSMHSSGSMMCSSLRRPEIASVGQRLVQAVQPMQVSRILYAMPLQYRVGPGLLASNRFSFSPPPQGIGKACTVIQRPPDEAGSDAPSAWL